MNRRRAQLTKRRKEYAARQNRTEFVGSVLPHNPALARRYAAELKAEVRKARDVIEREVRTLYPADLDKYAMDAAPKSKKSQAAQARILTDALTRRFAKHFAQFAPKLAARILGQVNKASNAQVMGSIKQASGGMSIKTPLLTDDIAAVFKASTAANVSLIKSISGKYLEQVQDAVLRNMQQGGTGLEGVLKEISHLGQVAERRADLIATDQVRKATAALNDAKLRRLGVKKFRWIHSGGGKEPRKLHLKYNGMIFDLDDPPVIDERTGERGLPGQLINCRCTMAPVLEFEA